MKKITLQRFLSLAAERRGPWAILVDDHVRAGAIELTPIEAALEADPELRIEKTEGKAGHWFKAWRGEQLVAQGYSSDADDAMLHGLFGAVREEHATHRVGERLDQFGYKTDAELRALLEQRFIRAGDKGEQQLEQDLLPMHLKSGRIVMPPAAVTPAGG